MRVRKKKNTNKGIKEKGKEIEVKGINLEFFLHVFDSASKLGPVGRGGGDGR